MTNKFEAYVRAQMPPFDDGDDVKEWVADNAE